MNQVKDHRSIGITNKQHIISWRTISRSAYILITHYSVTNHQSFGPTRTTP